LSPLGRGGTPASEFVAPLTLSLSPEGRGDVAGPAIAILRRDDATPRRKEAEVLPLAACSLSPKGRGDAVAPAIAILLREYADSLPEPAPKASDTCQTYRLRIGDR